MDGDRIVKNRDATLDFTQDTDDGALDSGGESLWKKMIGKLYSGKLNVRIDEGELEIGLCHCASSLLYPLPLHYYIRRDSPT